MQWLFKFFFLHSSDGRADVDAGARKFFTQHRRPKQARVHGHLTFCATSVVDAIEVGELCIRRQCFQRSPYHSLSVSDGLSQSTFWWTTQTELHVMATLHQGTSGTLKLACVSCNELVAGSKILDCFHTVCTVCANVKLALSGGPESKETNAFLTCPECFERTHLPQPRRNPARHLSPGDIFPRP